MGTLVLTVIGDDRSGLVEAVAEVVARHGASWDRSSMARLGTKFAGIVEVSVGDRLVDALVADLDPLTSQGLLEIGVENAGTDNDGDAAAGGADEFLTLDLVGQNRPGIVHEISRALAAHGVSIDELETASTSAPMSGEILFEAHALLRAPAGLDQDRLAAALEGLANELMVDIDLSDL
ncbi:glycine cleavage system protein R [Ilumatobacter nonamiensis]|uniref:glycine cleavage system protein R n=1 Tax=Ilumatobacter nonamiensis TaxID=467093 RepID=UPI00034D114B|nr:ACT domain-containing protein [Ilumatobacter nonamiensis]